MPTHEHQEKVRKYDNDAIAHIPVTDSMVIRDNMSQSNYSKKEDTPEAMENLSEEDSMTHHNLETEKNVRKAIENLELLTSKVAKDQISRSNIVT